MQIVALSSENNLSVNGKALLIKKGKPSLFNIGSCVE